MITITGTKSEIEAFAEGIMKANSKGGECFLTFKERECSIPDFRPCENCKSNKERGINCLTYHCKINYTKK